MLEVNQRKIKCPIFSAREDFIQKLNHDIWREDLSSGALMNKAHTLFVELDILSDCPKYNQDNIGCKTCKAISYLRKQSLVYLTGQTKHYPHLDTCSLSLSYIIKKRLEI